MAPEIRAIIITVSGQLLVVRCNYGARGLLQLELIPGLLFFLSTLENSFCNSGPGISGLNALGWPKPSVLYRNEEGQ